MWPATEVVDWENLKVATEPQILEMNNSARDNFVLGCAWRCINS